MNTRPKKINPLQSAYSALQTTKEDQPLTIPSMIFAPKYPQNAKITLHYLSPEKELKPGDLVLAKIYSPVKLGMVRRIRMTQKHGEEVQLADGQGIVLGWSLRKDILGLSTPAS